MAETSILIKNQTGGEAVAAREAEELDGNGNERIIQIMDQAPSKKIDLLNGTPHREAVDVVDTLDLDTFAVTPIVIGDAHTLVAVTSFQSSSDSTNRDIGCIITPLIYDLGDAVYSYLMPKYVTAISLSGTEGTKPLKWADTGETWNPGNVVSWEVGPFHKVALHLSYFGSSVAAVDIFAEAVSGAFHGVGADSNGSQAWNDAVSVPNFNGGGHEVPA